MWSKILTATGLAMALALPAAAQQSPSSSGSNASSGQQQGGMTGPNGTSIRQQIKQGLEKDGFTNVQVAPAAFVAQARNKQGQPVLMMIDPDHVTVLTAVDSPMQSGSGSSSSSSNSGGTSGSTSTK